MAYAFMSVVSVCRGGLIIIIITTIILIFGSAGVAKGKTPEASTLFPANSSAGRPAWHTEGGLCRETQALLFCPASLMLLRPQFRDSVLFPFRFILVFGGKKKKKKKKLFLTLSSVWEQNLFGCFGLCFLSPYLSADRAVPAHNRPAHRWRAGRKWARPPDRPWGAPRGPGACLSPDLILVPICRAVGRDS